MLFGPFVYGFILWALVGWLFKDSMDWRGCVIWAAIAVLVGWIFEHYTARLILPSDLQPDPDDPLIWTISSTDAAIITIAGLIGTMLTIFGVLWHRLGQIPVKKGIILFLVMGGVRVLYIIAILNGPESFRTIGPP